MGQPSWRAKPTKGLRSGQDRQPVTHVLLEKILIIFSLTAVNVNGNIHGEDLSSVLMGGPAVATMRLSAWVAPQTPELTICATSPSTVSAMTITGTGSAHSTQSVMTLTTILMMGQRMVSSKAEGGDK